jgi:hypothetical protein
LGERILSREDLLSALFNPAEVSSPEYQLIYNRLVPEIEEAEEAAEGLEQAISICDEFMCWAQAVKEELLRLRGST